MSTTTKGSWRPRVAVLGGGSFGTALAQVLAKGGLTVALWVRDPLQAEQMRLTRRNQKYLPRFTLADGVHPTSDMTAALAEAELVVSVSPSHGTRAVLKQAGPLLHPQAIVLCATKGMEIATRMLMSEVLAEVLPASHRDRTAYLSGPSFAREMMEGLPTVVTVAAHDHRIAMQVQEAFLSPYFRVYTVDDVIGVELAGAVKNVLAIAAGVSDGLRFGHNTRAALLTRGLAEMSRLGVRMGAKPSTFMGLAGVGDLVLTCTGDLSRNRQIGLKIASGMTLDEIQSTATQVAEGVNTARALHALAQELDVEMPIVEAAYRVLFENQSPRDAVLELMGRPQKPENV